MPITRVGFTGAVTSTNANLTVTEPAGVQQGDLLLVWVAHRSTIGFQTPASWTKLIDQSSGNTTVNGTGSIASGELFYIVRGASAPALTFTKEAGTGDVNIAHCLAYRGVDTTNPIAGSTSTTLASASATVVSGSTLAIGQDRMALLFIGGARNVTWSTQQTNTGPTSFSEVYDTGNANGADVSTSCAELLRIGAGLAAGTWQATASQSARHVIAAVTLNPIAYNAASTLTDNFDDNSRDTAKWNTGTFYNGMTAGTAPSETNGQLEIAPLASTASRYNGYISVNRYNLNGSGVFIRLKQTAAQASGVETLFGVHIDSNNYAEIGMSATDFSAFISTTGVGNPVGSVVPYSSDYAWLRIRESGGTIFFDTALATASDPPQESDWTNFRSAALSFGVSDVRVHLQAGTYAAVGSPGTAIYDGFNTGTSAGVTGTLSSTLANSTMSIAGTETMSGTLSSTLSGATMAASGSETFGGTLATTLADAVMSASGAIGNVSGTFSSVLSGTTMSMSGTETFSGTLSTTLADATMLLSGGANVTGELATTLQDAALSMAGAETFSGPFASALAGATMSASGAETFSGTLATTLAGASMSMTGAIANPVTGTLNTTLAGATMAMAAENSAAPVGGSPLEPMRKGRR